MALEDKLFGKAIGEIDARDEDGLRTRLRYTHFFEASNPDNGTDQSARRKFSQTSPLIIKTKQSNNLAQSDNTSLGGAVSHYEAAHSLSKSKGLSRLSSVFEEDDEDRQSSLFSDPSKLRKTKPQPKGLLEVDADGNQGQDRLETIES